MAGKYPSIPEPQTELVSLRSSQIAAKEGLEILMRQRGDKGLSAVTWYDLVSLGLISADRIPK